MKLALGILIIVVVLTVGYFSWEFKKQGQIKSSSKIISQEKEKPLEKYTFDNLSKTNFNPSAIELGEIIKEETDFVSRKFYFKVDPSVNSGQAKRVSGLVIYPKDSENYPVIVMFRGYVDKENYITGVGTQRVGEAFAKNGFITLAPDFLGYGESDDSSSDPMEERFMTYTTGITILKSVGNLNKTFESSGIGARADSKKLGIWGHSNGGQIAISVLEITQESTPTVLWAPVSKPFPYSILYYTDEYDDRGKYLRRVIADFEKDYNAYNYSIDKYFSRINAPIQIHQGSADDAVPKEWSDEFVKNLEDLEKDIEYLVYNGADHNMQPTGWNLAVDRSVEFYRANF